MIKTPAGYRYPAPEVQSRYLALALYLRAGGGTILGTGDRSDADAADSDVAHPPARPSSASLSASAAALSDPEAAIAHVPLKEPMSRACQWRPGSARLRAAH